VISQVWPQRRSAETGAGCGLVGGACCVGGAAVKGLGLASVASISSFVGAATPYFIGASLLLMLAWLLWPFRQTGYRPKLFARSLIRHGVVMGSIYGVTLAATMGVAYVAGVSM
jgi:hypothetical protein